MSTRGGFARAYTPEQTVNAEAWVRQCCIDQLGSPCLDGALSVKIGISVGIPTSWSKKKTAAALAGDISPTGKPDVDNCVKLLCDALNSVLWRDDAQIVEMTVRKAYANAPLTVMTVEAA
jgi:Holliday junction resolvase RusA-like endonuclease